MKNEDPLSITHNMALLEEIFENLTEELQALLESLIIELPLIREEEEIIITNWHNI